MPLHPRRKPDTEQIQQREKDAVGFAWRVHNAHEGWTAKVDTKASILLALEGGSLFAILAANSERGALRRLTGAALTLEVMGAALLFVSVLCSIAAIFPLLLVANGSVVRKWRSTVRRSDAFRLSANPMKQRPARDSRSSENCRACTLVGSTSPLGTTKGRHRRYRCLSSQVCCQRCCLLTFVHLAFRCGASPSLRSQSHLKSVHRSGCAIE